MIRERFRALRTHVHIVLLFVRVIIEMLAKADLLLQSVGFPAFFTPQRGQGGVQVFILQVGVRDGVLAEAGAAAPDIRQADRHLLQLARIVLLDVHAVDAEVARTHDLVAHQAHCQKQNTEMLSLIISKASVGIVDQGIQESHIIQIRANPRVRPTDSLFRRQFHD
jgi:hypothetical protein